MAMTEQEREHLLERAKQDFQQRLAGIAADPVQWITFIETVAVFGAQYSLGNQWLLLMQAAERGIEPRFFLPFGNREGTSGWKAIGRHVHAGERAYLVWAPVKRRPSEDEVARMETAGRTVARDADGRPAVQVVGFRPSSTFELSQTDGEPFEPPTVQRKRTVKAAGGRTAELLAGDDPTGAFDDTVALIKQAGYDFRLVPSDSAHLGGANGVTINAAGLRQVLVRDDVDGAQRIKTTMHELAHIRCGHLDSDHADRLLHRGRRETEAESVAHLVCRVLGLDTQVYSDAYVLGWADGDLDLVQECAEKVIRIARSILGDLTPPDPDRDPAAVTSGRVRGGTRSRASRRASAARTR
jgi:hypothetical protein